MNFLKLSDRVVRVLGQNPGKFTLQGTNTYFIGEGKDAYIPQLESALSDTCKLTNPNEPHISDIIISHWHQDHTGGLNSVLSLLRRMWDERNTPAQFKPPRIHKFPLVSAPSHSSTTIALPPPGYIHPHCQRCLPARPRTRPASSHNRLTMRVIHAPGHTTDSICLHIPDDRALYTADTVLGQGTAPPCASSSHFNLGHGPVVAEGPKLIGTYIYIAHRMEREAQTVSVIEEPSPEGQPWSTWGIVSTIYSAYPRNLWEPAARSVNQHLGKLQAEGKVKKLGGEGKDVKWELLAKL
ncbi:beta-lactamase-like protein [Suillus placidus]|uniref:Beta-lactamase-like protein n=1 Tax=Suillus placidus TaxID=48579 RepID=A0A9P6ZYL1_9AGAM|nr:beta-lactamase-like protein [Suillus placidus]